MKLVLEVVKHEHKTAEKSGRTVTWSVLWGKNANGTYCRCIAFGAVAESLDRELSRLTPPGEEAGDARLVVDLTGEWQDGREYVKDDGTRQKRREFRIATFDILTGPHLELARLRRDGVGVIAEAEEFRSQGRLDLAYRRVAEFVSQLCNRPLDLDGLEEAFADDDTEFGASDPEAAAAARYAAMDGPSEPMEIAPGQELPAPAESAAEPEPEAPEAGETEDSVMDIDEPVAEGDVLDDLSSDGAQAGEHPAEPEEGPAAEAQEAMPDPVPAPTTASAPSPRPAVPPRPGVPMPGFRPGIPRPPRAPGM